MTTILEFPLFGNVGANIYFDNDQQKYKERERTTHTLSVEHIILAPKSVSTGAHPKSLEYHLNYKRSAHAAEHLLEK